MKTILLTKGFFQALMSLAKKSMSLMVIMMVGLSLAMAGCDNNDKKNDKSAKDSSGDNSGGGNTGGGNTGGDNPGGENPTGGVEVTEEAVLGDVMITFSATNDLMMKYPSFKLGLYDITAYVRTESDLLPVSMYGLETVSSDQFDQVVPLELSKLEMGSHLYHGEFKLPVGDLEAVSIQFSGLHSNVTIDMKEPTLIDAFFSGYNSADSRIESRVMPAHTMVELAEAIEISDTSLTMLDVKVDMNVTASMEPLAHADPARDYALFTPSFKVMKMMPSSENPMPMSIHQIDVISMADMTPDDAEDNMFSLGMGDTDGMFFSTKLSKADNAMIKVDGDAGDLGEMDGLYAVDMMGTFSTSADGHMFEVKHASLAAMAEDNTASIYSGSASVEGENVTIMGTKQMLDASESALMGTMPSTMQIDGIATSAGIEDGKMVSVWYDGTDAKLISSDDMMPMPAEESLVFYLHSTVSYLPADILSIGSADETNADAMTLTLSEELDCANYVKDLATGAMKSDCGETLKTITFDKTITEGMYTLHSTRKGTVSGEDDTKELSLEADRVMHYASAADFTMALKSMVDEGYRLAVLSADGTIAAGAFTVGSKAKAIILQPHAELDAENDSFVTGLEEDGGALAAGGALEDDSGKSVGLYAGLGALAGAGALAILADHVFTKAAPYIFKRAEPVTAVDGTSGSLVRTHVDGVPVDYIVQHVDSAGKVTPTNMTKQLDGSVVTPTLDDTGEVIEGSFGKVINADGSLAENIEMRKIVSTPAKGDTMRFAGVDGAAKKLFYKDSSNGWTEVTAITKSADGNKYTDNIGTTYDIDLDKGEVLTTSKNLSVSNREAYLFADSVEDATARDAEKKSFAGVVLEARDKGELPSKKFITDSALKMTAGEAFDEALLSAEPMSAARKAAIEANLEGTAPNRTVKADLDLAEASYRRTTFTFVDNNTDPATNKDVLVDARKARIGGYSEVITEQVSSKYDTGSKSYKVAIGSDTNLNITKMTYKRGDTDVTIDGADLTKGTLKVYGSYITASSASPTTPARLVASINDAGELVQADGVTELKVFDGDTDITDSLRASMDTELKRAATASTDAAEAIRKQNTTFAKLFESMKMKLFAVNERVFQNAQAAQDRQTVAERIKTAVSNLSATVVERLKAVKAKTKARTAS